MYTCCVQIMARCAPAVRRRRWGPIVTVLRQRAVTAAAGGAGPALGHDGLFADQEAGRPHRHPQRPLRPGAPGRVRQPLGGRREFVVDASGRAPRPSLHRENGRARRVVDDRVLRVAQRRHPAVRGRADGRSRPGGPRRPPRRRTTRPDRPVAVAVTRCAPAAAPPDCADCPYVDRVCYIKVISLTALGNPPSPSLVGSVGRGADCHVRKRADRARFVIESGVSFLD